MASCKLSARGCDFDVDAYLKTSVLGGASGLRVFRKGEATGSALRPFTSRSGFEIDISTADKDDVFENLIEKARDFLTANQVEIARLVSYPGVEDALVDFELHWLGDTICYPISLPASFMLTAGQCGLAADLKVLAVSE